MTTAPAAPDTALAHRQSLSQGALGIALLDIERAHRGTGPWEAVQRRLAAIGPLIDGSDASLFLGAPAMAYVMHQAAADTDRYAGALRALDAIVADHTNRRLFLAHERINQGAKPAFCEYDLIRGLTGLGVLLLRRSPGRPEIRGVLEYLVRLTEPIPNPAGGHLPGWWVGHGPARLGSPAPGGHANAGIAHGITGPLALLALAKRQGVTVRGQDEAMERICRWLDQIRQIDQHGVRWPRWINETAAVPTNTATPSWCYGTPGLVRAQQLAAIALGDAERKHMAERALLYCLADSRQLDQLMDRGLCHGVGGLLRVVQRVAEDADNPGAFTRFFPALNERFLSTPPAARPEFLTGSAGAVLAFQSAEAGTRSVTDWDACLLLI